MSDITPVEERLFLALDAIEKLAEETKKVQAVTTEQQAFITQNFEKVFSVVDAKVNDFKITQKSFNSVVQNAVYTAAVYNIADSVYKEVNKAVDKATAQSMFKLVAEIKKTTESMKTGEGLVSEVQLDNLEQSEKISKALLKQEKSLATKHYKLVTMFGGGMFLVMCFVLFIFYHLVVPSENELRNLKHQREMLQKDVARLTEFKGIYSR